MKIREVMTPHVIKIDPNEAVEVAARMLKHYNIGMLPVCTADGRLQGVVTDRDLVTRCMASGKISDMTKVQDVMSGGVVSATPDMDTGAAAHLMGRKQVRRLPVLENGKLCGMVSLGDLAVRQESNPDAADALGEISNHIRLDDQK